jgi:hypothetical protein
MEAGCMGVMSRKKPHTSHRPTPVGTPSTSAPSSSDEPVERDVKALTVNVPAQVLHRAKTRASLEGTTMSAVVSDALVIYAEGLKDVLGPLGFVEK